MQDLRFWKAVVAGALTSLLVACGGGGNSSGAANVRLVNATQTHASLNLLANSTAAINSTAADTVSAYAGVPEGGPTLQLNDATTGAVLGTTAPSVGKDAHYALIAYESGGTVRTTIVQEDTSAPTTGNASVRVLDLASDAGALDVYITDPAVDISTLSSPTFSFGSGTTTQVSSAVSFAPATYRIRVTGAGNVGDLRLDVPSVAIGNQQLVTVVVTPTIGGTLVNGATLVQQGAYTATRNASARIRVVADVGGGGAVTARAGTATLANNVVSPAVGSYAVVPAASALTVTVNGATVTAPTARPAAGGDYTLSVFGNTGAPVATLITDDNHLPSTASNFKIRLYNGLTGAQTPLSLAANFAQVASNVPPGAASSYASIVASTATRLDVDSGSGNVYSESALNVPANGVYTLFMIGDASAPVHLLRRDH